MNVGIAYFASDLTSDIRDVARAAEAAGFESLWVPEHTHIPTLRQTPYPMGGELPAEYARTMDPFVALTAGACATTTLRLGTGVIVVAEHDPIVLAKVVSTLDVISGGRVLFGVGAGWNVEEMSDHGVAFADRWDVMEQRVGLMQQLWGSEVASYSSTHAHLPPSWQWPKPVQSPVPVLVGGLGPRSMRHAVRYGTSWMPMPNGESTTDRIAALHRLADEAEKPVPAITMYAVRPDRNVIEHYGELGVERCVVLLPPEGDTVAAVGDLATQIL